MAYHSTFTYSRNNSRAHLKAVDGEDTLRSVQDQLSEENQTESLVGAPEHAGVPDGVKRVFSFLFQRVWVVEHGCVPYGRVSFTSIRIRFRVGLLVFEVNMYSML